MDFLNKAYAQTGELFKSMSPGARITAGMLLVTIVVSLIYLLVFQVHTGHRYLYGGQQFTPEELVQIQDAFAEAHLDDYDPGDGRIRVPSRKFNDYVQALVKADFMPENWDSSIDEALSSTNAFFEPRHFTDMKMNHAVQQKLAQVISDHAEIDRATVQYREVNKGGWPPAVERKATVVVSGKSNRKISPALVNVIRATASGWFGIRGEDVMVTDLNGSAYPPPEVDGLGKDTKLYAEMKQLYEEQWKEKIYDCLSVYPGIVVGVNVEMDPDIINESNKVVVDPQPTALKSETFSKTQESRPSVGGRPGAEPNEVPSNRPRDIQTIVNQETTSDENREQQLSVTGHEQTNSKKAPLVPLYATATVSVPKSYFHKLWQQDNPTPEGEEPKTPTDAELQAIETEIIERIKEKVVRTLPRREAGEDPFPQVEVSSYADLPVEPLEPPPVSATALVWLSLNWPKLGLLGVGLVSLLVLRSMIRGGTPATDTPAPALTQPTVPEESEEVPEEMPVVLHRRVVPTGSSLREELTAMVREDPDAAANVLRTWIGDAA